MKTSTKRGLLVAGGIGVAGLAAYAVYRALQPAPRVALVTTTTTETTALPAPTPNPPALPPTTGAGVTYVTPPSVGPLFATGATTPQPAPPPATSDTPSVVYTQRRPIDLSRDTPAQLRERVVVMQHQLAALGYMNGVPNYDGIVGPQTRAALRAFAADMHLGSMSDAQAVTLVDAAYRARYHLGN